MKHSSLRILFLGLMGSVAMFAIACSSSGTSDTDGTTEPSATASATETETSGEGDDGEIAETVQGKEVARFYQLNCSSCHGLDQQGIVGPALTVAALTQDDQFYIDTISNGRAGTVMPSWAANGLTMPEIRALVHWLKEGAPKE